MSKMIELSDEDCEHIERYWQYGTSGIYLRISDAVLAAAPSAPTFKLGDRVHVEYDGQIVGVDSDAALRLYTVEVFDDEWSMVPGYLAAEHLTRIDEKGTTDAKND